MLAPRMVRSIRSHIPIRHRIGRRREPGLFVKLPYLLETLATRSRRRRYEVLLHFLRSFAQPPSILDVGGTLGYWRTVEIPHKAVRRLVLLNSFPQEVFEPFESVIGDARDLSRYSAHEFDIVFSNSVIGQVGGFDDQMRMASEMRRVGRFYFLQTPNQGFFLDWRTLVPFFHFLPASVQAWCFRTVPVGRYRRAKHSDEARNWATRVRDVRRAELPLLFPGATIVNERVAGMTKSFILHNFDSSDVGSV